jgi:hypothetical protein
VTVDFIIRCLKHEKTFKRWMLYASEAYISSSINQNSDILVLKGAVPVFGRVLQQKMNMSFLRSTF